MNEDYSRLYGTQNQAAPPFPEIPPSAPAANPYNRPLTPPPSDIPPKPFVLNSSEAPPMPMPYPVPPPPVYRQPVVTPPPPPKPKQPFSPIPLLLIAGVAFLFLGGIIFLTNTWATLPDMARAVALLSAGVISFGANALAEKIFRLPKTGLAFYILGCIFLPLAIAGIGAFSLFGEWFSFHGDGKSLVGAAITACVGLTSLAGVRNYKHPFLAWMSLAGAAATWFWLSAFLVQQIGTFSAIAYTLFCGLMTVFAFASSVWAEWQLRRSSDSPFGKAALFYLYPYLLITILLFSTCILANFPEPEPSFLHARIMPAVFSVPVGVLMLSRRFVQGNFHTGMIGITLAVLNVFTALAKLPVFAETSTFSKVLFVLTASSMLLMAVPAVPRISDALRKTAAAAGSILSLPMLLAGSIRILFTDGSSNQYLLVLLMVMSAVFFAVTKRNPLSKDTPLCAVYTALLYLTAILAVVGNQKPLYSMLLILAALVLLVQAFLYRRMWGLVLAVGACAAMILLNLAQPIPWLLWLGTAMALGGVIYSHVMKRGLLEKCCAWVMLPLLLTALLDTLHEMLELPYGIAFLLVMAAVTLLYLLEAVALRRHERTKGTVPYLEITAVLGSFTVFLYYLIDSAVGKREITTGWSFLLLLLLGIFSVVFTRKRINLWAIPHLFMLFFTARHMIAQISEMQVIGWNLPLPDTLTPDTAASLLQVGCFILLLVGFAVMGRVLLPKFFETGDGILRVDLPLLAGVLPVTAAAVTIDWYPELLLSLFLTVYSLLYIGRLKNRFIPMLLASLFGCTTILFHNIDDPFGLIDKLTALNIQTLRILLYLLPLHLFIFTLLFILPKNARPGVHIARFVMYCITMFSLLLSSLNFGNVADAIILVVFSFAILVGSFAVKRLRWFVLGFAVLVLMTIHLTWEFWTSLHWGIYLFLAGILLIALASVYEYSARYAREHPDEPKKKFRLFAAWKW